MAVDLRAQEHDAVRAFSEFEARQNKDGSWKVGGYASTFNDPYDVHDRYGTFAETILPGAWDRTLSERGHKIQLLESHGGIPYASTKTDSLRLGADKHGLGWEWDVPTNSQRANDLAAGIRDGYIDEMSVGMRIPKGGDTWNESMTERQIAEASLLEISVVARGANPNTEAAQREQELLAEIRSLQGALKSGAFRLPDQREETEEVSREDLERALFARQPRIPITEELAELLKRRQ